MAIGLIEGCDLTGGWELADNCRNGRGGVRRLIIGPYNSSLYDVISVTGSYGNILQSWGGATPSGYVFEQAREVAGFTAPGEYSDPNSVAFRRPAVSFVLGPMGDDSNGLADILDQGYWFVWVQDANGVYWFVNPTTPMTVSAGDTATGTAGGDLNGNTLTLTGAETKRPIRIPANLMTPVILP